jgi:hypothetical protein
VDETGHSGDTGAADDSTGAESRDRTLLNGWATPNSPWSNAGAALDPADDDVPSWRRPAAEIRPFTRQPPNHETSGDIRPFRDQNPSGEVRPFETSHGPGEAPHPYGEKSEAGYGEPIRPAFGEVPRPLGDAGRSREVSRGENSGPSWSAGQVRYSELLDHFSPHGSRSAQPPPDPRPFEHARNEQARHEQARHEQARHEQARNEQARNEQARNEQARNEQARNEQARNEQARSEPTRIEPARTEPPRVDPQPGTHPEPVRPGVPQPAATPPGFLRAGSLDALAPGTLRPPTQRPESLQADDERRTNEMRTIVPATPSSAPPYPYEGDLDDARRESPSPTSATQQRNVVPLSRSFPAVRPAAPGGRRVDWIATESARHALEPTPAEGLPRADASTTAEPQPATAEPASTRSSYDPSTFPRRLAYDPSAPPSASAPPADTSSGYAAPSAYPGGLLGRSSGDPGPAEPISRALPQRVPAEPDVPTVPEPPSVEPPAETPALARIATHLRRDDALSAEDRQEGFDVKAILEAVREVAGVRDASLRSTPQGANSLRLDLAEGADPAEVSRQVARLLQDRMGLDAAMQGGPPSVLPPPAPSASGSAPVPTTPLVPTQQPGRAPVSGAPTGAQARSFPQAGRRADPLTDELPPGPAYGAAPSTSSGTVETVSAVDCGPPRPLEVGERAGLRAVIENVQVNTFGTKATVEVRLGVESRTAAGVATGPAVDGYLLRLCAMATANAIDELLSTSDHVDGPASCYVEHAACVPFGPMQVAVVVMLLSCGDWVEELAGSAVVTGDDRHAMVRATLAAVNRRLEALLS